MSHWLKSLRTWWRARAECGGNLLLRWKQREHFPAATTEHCNSMHQQAWQQHTHFTPSPATRTPSPDSRPPEHSPRRTRTPREAFKDAFCWSFTHRDQRRRVQVHLGEGHTLLKYYGELRYSAVGLFPVVTWHRGTYHRNYSAAVEDVRVHRGQHHHGRGHVPGAVDVVRFPEHRAAPV